MHTKMKYLVGVALGLAFVSSAIGAGFLTNGLPPAGGTQYPSTLPLTGNETLPADTNLTQGLNPASEAVSVNQLNAGVMSLPGAVGFRNALIGGDFNTNLWQRGTTVGSITTPFLYTADRFFAWSGTSTTMSVAQDTTAAELPTGYLMAAKIARTGAGIIQTCIAQEVESSTAARFQGQTAELDFHAYAGAGFSAAGGALSVYIVTGTSTDEGAQKFAWGLNAGGGGSTAWTGQANALAGTSTLTVSALNNVAAFAKIPVAAKEIGVAICWTPVGGSPSNDYIALSGVQLTINNSNSAYAGTVQNGATINRSAFERRPSEVEGALQQRYTYSINEASQTAGAIVAGGGTALGTSTTCSIGIRFPVTMRIAPTYTNALTASTFKLTSASQAATALSTPFSATLGANSVDSASVNFTTTGMTAKDGCELVSAAGTGQMLWTAEL